MGFHYILNPPRITKLQWKKLLNSSIATFVENSWKTEVATCFTQVCKFRITEGGTESPNMVYCKVKYFGQ